MEIDYSAMYAQIGDSIKQAFIDALRSFVYGLINYDYPQWLPLLLPITFSLLLINIGVKTIMCLLDGIRPFSPMAFVHEYGSKTMIDDDGNLYMEDYDDIMEWDEYGYLPGDYSDWSEVEFLGV